MEYRIAELASVGAAEQVIQAYDVANDEWNLPMKGSFWEAIQLAQAAGYRGQGRRIAILDSSCDLSIPRLKRQIEIRRDSLDGEPNQHGTAVALLVSLVAPEAKIDFYSVTRDGQPDFHAIQRAVQEAAQTNANVITMSLGAKTNIYFLDHIEDALARNDMDYAMAHTLECSLRNNGRGPIRSETPPCSLCNAATTAVAAGKMVFAAVGNDMGSIFCPARATDVIAVGFQLEERAVKLLPDGGYTESSRSAQPSYSQATSVDVSLKQPSGVLGSSFACPLLAGAATLGFHGNELQKFVASVRLASIACDIQNTLSKNSSDAEIELAEIFYHAALEKHPHRHDPIHEKYLCFTCGILSEPLFVNGGLFFLNTNKLQEAERLLRIARWFAPWSADAAANLGRTLQRRAEHEQTSGRKDSALSLLTEALEHYEAALRSRPGFVGYQWQVEHINGLFRAWF